jgi:hypothetical protein
MFTTFTTKLPDRFNQFSFKTKVRLLTIALGVTPIVAIGALNYFQIRTASEQQTIHAQKLRAQAVADKLNRFLFERYGDIQVLSTLPIFSNPKFSANTSVADKENLLDRYVASYQVYDSIAVFDLQGKRIYQSKSEPLTQNHSDRPYFQAALKTGKAVISDPTFSKYTGKAVVFFAAPIKDSTTGKIIAVIRSRTPIDRLQIPLQDFATKIQDFHILDRRSNKVFMSSNGEYNDKPEDADLAQARQQGGLVRRQQSHGTDPTGNWELVAAAPFQPLQGMPELPWTAFVTLDEDAAYLELQGLLWTILAGFGFTSALTVGVSTLLADRITKYIQRVIKTILASSGEIVDTVQQQEVTVNEQANSALQTTNTVNQLGSFSFQAAEQADASAVGARQALVLAEEGTKAVRETLEGMNNLQEKVDAIALQIANLSEQTGQISNVSEIVGDLAYQTNMLALKAAVEAARAGEQGKGFGVVAGEIRKLADRSKKSAEKINLLATDIQTEINRTVMVTEEGTKTVQAGIELAETTSSTFVGVTTAVNNLFLNSQQISESAKQQAVAIQQVLNAMNSIAQGSQESAVSMFRVKSSTREINQIADELQTVLN